MVFPWYLFVMSAPRIFSEDSQNLYRPFLFFLILIYAKIANEPFNYFFFFFWKQNSGWLSYMEQNWNIQLLWLVLILISIPPSICETIRWWPHQNKFRNSYWNLSSNYLTEFHASHISNGLFSYSVKMRRPTSSLQKQEHCHRRECLLGNTDNYYLLW